MRRPTMYQLTLLSLFPLALGASPHRCKVVPDSPDWPTQRDWTAFNESLGGRLLQPAPPGAVCHPGQRGYGEQQCADVAAAWRTYDFHAGHPSSVMWDNFANDTCLPDARYMCSPQGYPAYVVNASTPEHAKLGIAFGESRRERDALGRLFSIANGRRSSEEKHPLGRQGNRP